MILATQVLHTGLLLKHWSQKPPTFQVGSTEWFISFQPSLTFAVSYRNTKIILFQLVVCEPHQPFWHQLCNLPFQTKHLKDTCHEWTCVASMQPPQMQTINLWQWFGSFHWTLGKQTSPTTLAWCIWSYQMMLPTSVWILDEVESLWLQYWLR